MRVEAAAKEFESHGVSHLVTARQRDVCRDGFDLEGVADAVFLDLPHPWDAVPHAKKAIKASGGRLCSFSPCVEQVQKAIAKMKEEGFREISTVECLLREFQVRRITVPIYDPERKRSIVGEESKKRKLEEDGEEEEEDKKDKAQTKDPETSFLTGVPLLAMPGHTGYLTFATLPPKRKDEVTTTTEKVPQ